MTAAHDVRARPLVHLGYPKAASSWLQELVFSDPGAGFVHPADRGDSTEIIVAPHPLDFDAEVARKELDDSLFELDHSGLVAVLSSERFVGNPHSGGYDSKEIADRLHALMPMAKVLMVIREQKDIIASTYSQYLRKGGACSLIEYLFPVRDLRVPLFSLDFFAYHKLIGYYQELYGRHNFCVLTIEELRNDPRHFLTRLQEFAGVRNVTGNVPSGKAVNAAMSPFSRDLKRRVHFTASRSSLNPHAHAVRTLFLERGRHTATGEKLLSRRRQEPSAAGMKETGEAPLVEAAVDRLIPSSVQRRLEARLRADINAAVGDYYRESNVLTQRATGVDLASLGYDI